MSKVRKLFVIENFTSRKPICGTVPDFVPGWRHVQECQSLWHPCRKLLHICALAPPPPYHVVLVVAIVFHQDVKNKIFRNRTGKLQLSVKVNTWSFQSLQTNLDFLTRYDLCGHCQLCHLMFSIKMSNSKYKQRHEDNRKMVVHLFIEDSGRRFIDSTKQHTWKKTWTSGHRGPKFIFWKKKSSRGKRGAERIK